VTPAEPRIAVLAAGGHAPGAARLADALALPLATDEAGTFELLLVVDDDGLALRAPGDRTGVRADVSFVAGRSANLSRRQALARAIGRRTRTVLDATAGLGHDAALLAAIGFEVTAVERAPVIAALLEDGLARALAEPAVSAVLDGRLAVRGGVDARAVLADMDPPPDAVYIDPMFPPKRKASALAKKRIRMVRSVVGDDDDAADLLARARQAAGQRVVVKRPTDAGPLAGPAPASCIETKLVRYDVYPV
jgi:16S rRNA (guanine1516-N2)-methyltransferase